MCSNGNACFCYTFSNCLMSNTTVLNISKLKKLTATAPQPFYNVFLFLRTLCIVWNLVRRRVTRRLTRLQTMYNVLKYSKTWWINDDISIYRYRTGTGNKFNLIMRMTVPAGFPPSRMVVDYTAKTSDRFRWVTNPRTWFTCSDVPWEQTRYTRNSRENYR